MLFHWVPAGNPALPARAGLTRRPRPGGDAGVAARASATASAPVTPRYSSSEEYGVGPRRKWSVMGSLYDKKPKVAGISDVG